MCFVCYFTNKSLLRKQTVPQLLTILLRSSVLLASCPSLIAARAKHPNGPHVGTQGQRDVLRHTLEARLNFQPITFDA